MTAAANMRFTVLICTKDRCESLARTLAAVEGLADAGQREVVVVDNGSTDDTAKVVARAAVCSRWSVRYIHCDARGKSAALNAGIAAAKGEIVAFTDDDALPAHDWLVEIDRVFRQDHCEWAYGRVVPLWESQQPSWFSPEIGGLFALMDLGPHAFMATIDTPAFAGVNCAASRKALAGVGGYRTDLGPKTLHGGGGEDTEMFGRALAAGQRIAYEPGIVVTHVIPRDRVSRGFHRRRMWAGGPNNYRLLQSAPSGGDRRAFGIPVYHFSLAADDLGAWVRAVVVRDRAQAFYREIRLVRFAATLSHAVTTRLSPEPPEEPSTPTSGGGGTSWKAVS